MLIIQINNTNLHDRTKYSVVSLNHEQIPNVENNLMKISDSHGIKFITQHLNPKEIVIEGFIKGTSQEDLEHNIDDLKKAVYIQTGSLYIGYSGEVRRYDVTLGSCSIGRKNVDVTHATFSISFLTIDKPFATESTMGSTDIEATSYSASSITQSTFSAVWSFGGNVEPEPLVRIVYDGVTSVTRTDLTNRTTGDMLSINSTFSAGDQLFIDIEGKQAILNGQIREYDGVFPEFKVGDNVVEISNTGLSTVILDQQQTAYSNPNRFVYQNVYYAQSFTAGETGTLNYIKLFMSEPHNVASNSYTHGNLVVSIYSDSGDAPNALLGTKTKIKSPTGEGLAASWYKIAFSGVSVTDGTTYWIVVSSPNSSLYNDWHWYSYEIIGKDLYSGGEGKISINSGASWLTMAGTNDFKFKTFVGTTSPATYDVKCTYSRKYL